MEVIKILGDWLEANTFIIKKEQEAIIIDSGAGLEKVKDVLKNIKVLGILLTHGHFDHTAYTLEYIKEFNCSAFGSYEIKKTLVDTEKNFGKGFFIDDFSRFKFLYEDGEFSLGNFKIKNFSCAGHCPCCEGYLIDNLLFAGDTLFSSGIGRIDMITSNKEDMINSLKKLKNINFITLFSGHGEESGYERQQRNISAYIKFLNR